MTDLYVAIHLVGWVVFAVMDIAEADEDDSVMQFFAVAAGWLWPLRMVSVLLRTLVSLGRIAWRRFTDA